MPYSARALALPPPALSPAPAEDPVREAEYNIRRVRALWARAARLAAAGIDRFADSHNALGALEALEADEATAGGAARPAGVPAAAVA